MKELLLDTYALIATDREFIQSPVLWLMLEGNRDKISCPRAWNSRPGGPTSAAATGAHFGAKEKDGQDKDEIYENRGFAVYC